MRQEKTEALRVLPLSAMPSSAHPEQMNKWITLVAIAPGVFMGNLDASIVNTSLPAIAHSFGTTLGGLIEWVVIAYLMVIAGVLLTVGRLADLVGRKPIWGAGLMIFTAGSVLCGAAPNLLLLIAARGFQGLGAALLMAVGPAVLAPLTGILADRLGTRWLAAGGLAIACLGLVFVSLLNATSSILDIAWRLVVVGLGQALFQSPNSSALMGAVPSVQQGSASGFMATSRVVGQSLSVALAGTIFAAAGGAQARHLLSTHHGQELAASTHTLFLQGFHAAVLTSAAIAAVGIFASLIRGQDSNASARGR